MLYWAQNNEALGSRASRSGRSRRASASRLLGGAFAFLNYAFDEISNPALRPVRRLIPQARDPFRRPGRRQPNGPR